MLARFLPVFFALAFLVGRADPAWAVDTDGDGLDDSVESTLGTNPGLADSDFDLIDDFVETNGGSPVDTDGDAVIDALDDDSDGDGYLDLVESDGDTDADGVADFRDLDSDGDSVLDIDEFDGDFDADGTANRIDDDDDGDGIPTIVEGNFDVDGDGNLNYLDFDSDDDGYSDAVEGVGDPDADGTPNFVDFDSDDDGFPDAQERVAGSDPYDPASTPGSPGPAISPEIAAVSDVGNDQGRRLRLRWTRSSLDVVGSDAPILDYAVYRRIDAGLATEGAASLRRASAGDWDFVGSIPATTELEYATLVESLCDSTEAGPCWSVYFVRALTASPGLFYDSEPDSGMSIDNLAPSAPASFAVDYGVQNTLTWDPSPEADFRYFKVYRGNGPDFSPATGTLVRTTTETGWVDAEGGAFEYLVSAVDFAGNEGPAASPAMVTATDDAPRRRATLEQNVPNPFNPRTSIAFELEATGSVTLRIHDASGRLVRVLVDGIAFAPGRHSVVWDGTDASGTSVGTGVYLYTIDGPGITASRRMVLVR